MKRKIIHDWISRLMKSMDGFLDEETKIRLMEECGRACAQSHTKKEALKFKGKLEGWLKRMKKMVGEKNVQREESSIRVTYSKCYCPVIREIQPFSSDAYCNCGQGWLKEIFETVVERPVEVKLEDSIVRGGRQCSFIISL